jgi:hypothetical protein
MGFISGLAEDISRSEKHVYRLKMAYETYRDLRASFGATWLRWARRELTVTHFIRAGELQRRYEFDPPELFHILDAAAMNHASVGAMTLAIEGEHGGDDRPEWVRISSRIRAHLTTLTAGDAPERVRAAAAALVAALEEGE